MRRRCAVCLVVAALLVMLAVPCARAETGAIRTFLTFRITTETQNAIVNVGEDLQIEVGVEGVVPTGYQWYFEGAPIAENGNDRIYNLLNASHNDEGIYTMEAYSGEHLILKVEINVRVIDPTIIPASGDDSVPVETAFAALFGCGAALTCLVKARRRHA